MIQPTAAIVIIGNEILSGKVQDSNVNFIAMELLSVGIKLIEVRTVLDRHEDIARAVQELSIRTTYTFTTGGIGPTHDDITAEAIAQAFKRNLVIHPEACERIQNYYGKRFNESHLRMATLPEGAKLIENPVTVSPGFYVENIYVFPGVPAIMQAMFKLLKPQLNAGPVIYTDQVQEYVSESGIAKELSEIQKANQHVEIGSYPFVRNGKIGVSLVVSTLEKDALQDVLSLLRNMLEKHK